MLTCSLTPDVQHRKVFPKVSIVGFKRGKSLKDLSVRGKIQKEKGTEGKSCCCQRKHCQVCTFLKEKTVSLTKRVVIHIRKGKIFISIVIQIIYSV